MGRPCCINPVMPSPPVMPDPIGHLCHSERSEGIWIVISSERSEAMLGA